MDNSKLMNKKLKLLNTKEFLSSCNSDEIVIAGYNTFKKQYLEKFQILDGAYCVELCGLTYFIGTIGVGGVGCQGAIFIETFETVRGIDYKFLGYIFDGGEIKIGYIDINTGEDHCSD